jgi:ATP-binding cassette subfamily F protein 3
MITLEHVSIGFGAQKILTDASFHINEGERIGLVGANGSGKTTLLRLIAGLIEADRGKVNRPTGLKAGYLPQDGVVHRGRTLKAEVLHAREDILNLEREMQALTTRISALSPADPSREDVLEKYSRAESAYRLLDGYALEARAEQVMDGLGFGRRDREKMCEHFSGGWQMRIALARLLLAEPDVLLLDEPTNHLDLETRNWLEDYLKGYPHAVMLVSHDRYFLDVLVDRLIEIDAERLHIYHTNYTGYLQERGKRHDQELAAFFRQKEEIEKIEDFIARNRSRKDRARVVQSRIRTLEKMERLQPPRMRRDVKIQFPQPGRPPKDIIVMEQLAKAYGEKTVFDGLDLVIHRDEKIGLVGPNGAGKSTLLRLLAGTEPHDRGSRRLGPNVSLGFFSQERMLSRNQQSTILQFLEGHAPLDMIPRLRGLLGAFLFSGDDVEKPLSVLSGGELSRVELARLLLKSHNILLLDEPTNHLDIQSKDILMEALIAYEGTLVFVSHDRYFLNSLSGQIIEVGGGGCRHYPGNYDDYLRAKKREAAGPGADHPQPEARAEKKKAPSAEKAARIEARRQKKEEDRARRRFEKQVAGLESRIETLESETAELDRRMADKDNATKHEYLFELHTLYQEKKKELEKCYQAWHEAVEKKDPH